MMATLLASVVVSEREPTALPTVLERARAPAASLRTPPFLKRWPRRERMFLA
jgi:hypothetical protein